MLRSGTTFASPRVLQSDKQHARIWLRCEYPVVAQGLTQVLESVAEVCEEPPREPTTPSCVVLCTDMENVAREVRDVRRELPDTPVLVVGLINDVQCARSALRAGATGFIHVGMGISQIHRALDLACESEIVVPRDLVAQLVKEEETIDPLILTARPSGLSSDTFLTGFAPPRATEPSKGTGPYAVGQWSRGHTLPRGWAQQPGPNVVSP